MRQTFHNQPPTSYLHAKSVGWSYLRRLFNNIIFFTFLDFTGSGAWSLWVIDMVFSLLVPPLHNLGPRKLKNVVLCVFSSWTSQTHHRRIFGCPWTKDVHSLHNSDRRGHLIIFHHLLRQLLRFFAHLSNCLYQKTCFLGGKTWNL